MCFSAPASFIAASGLSVTGALSLVQARKRKIIPLAMIPLFFALQQVCEGIVWLTMQNTNSPFHKLGVGGFMFFASIWWPVWIPFSLFLAEENRTRKEFLGITIFTGALVASLYAISWILYSQRALIVDHHIAYPLLTAPFSSSNIIIKYIDNVLSCLYLVATVLPLFISSIKYMWLIGLIIATLCISTIIFFASVFGSLWCFFSAVASVLIYFIMRGYK